jgi:hypothetical protein
MSLKYMCFITPMKIGIAEVHSYFQYNYQKEAYSPTDDTLIVWLSILPTCPIIIKNSYKSGTLGQIRVLTSRYPKFITIKIIFKMTIKVTSVTLIIQ